MVKFNQSSDDIFLEWGIGIKFREKRFAKLHEESLHKYLCNFVDFHVYLNFSRVCINFRNYNNRRF